MGITKDRGYWYFVKRVPKRFAHVDARQRVTRALWTDSEREARAKAPAVEAEFMAYWEALAAGESADAAAAYDAAKRLAQARGFPYRRAADLAAGSVEEILSRIEALVRSGDNFNPAESAALLGFTEAPEMTLSAALSEMFDFAAIDRLAGKSAGQVKRWKLPRERAVTNFILACGNLPIREINRTNAQEFREFWSKRITNEGRNPETANKDIGHLSDLFKTWCQYHALDLPNPFEKLRFKSRRRKKTTGLPFSAEWIRDRLLKPRALERLNDEARDILLVMVNTGARPSEIIGREVEDFKISAETPYLDIISRQGRGLKTDSSERKIPLLGVSLEAAKRIVARGGIKRYRDKETGWSNAANKYLRENGLRETPDHSAYSLRHSFEDRMTEAGVDDRIRAELMGHEYDRPDYGRGGSLEVRRRALEPVSF